MLKELKRNKLTKKVMAVFKKAYKSLKIRRVLKLITPQLVIQMLIGGIIMGLAVMSLYGTLESYTNPPHKTIQPAAIVVPTNFSKVLIKTHRESRITEPDNKVYTFKNPKIAENLLLLLEFNKLTYSKKSDLHDIRLKIRNDSNYCRYALQTFVNHPETLFQQKNIITDYKSTSITRQIVRNISNDLVPHLFYYGPKRTQRPFYFPYHTNFFFITEYIHENYVMGKNFACGHQVYNKMLRINSLANKATIAQNNENYIASYERADKGHCVSRFLPESYLMWNKTQCTQFFDYINSPAYWQEKKKYGTSFIKKEIGTHQGKGVSLFDEETEIMYQERYKGGSKCGRQPSKKIQMQKYITNPLLLYGHKCDLRIYMLIASTNPFIVFYHDGFLRVSLDQYTADSKEKGAHFTNTHLAEEKFKEANRTGTWDGMTEKELRDFQSWSFTRLQNYLIDNGKISDPDWINNSLRYQLKVAIVHLMRMSQSTLKKLPNTYQLWGLDFIFDDNLKLWFIEANTRPALKGSSDEKRVFMTKMIHAQFDIVYGLLRSRMKRVVLYINKVTDTIPKKFITKKGNVKWVPDFPDVKKEFNKVNKNKFEKEFEHYDTEEFHKVMDENYLGPKRYAGLLDENCYKF
jgi:hypothetical protein